MIIEIDALKDPTVVLSILMVVGLLIWSVRLWKNPHYYNPSSFWYRYLYLWYAARAHKEVDETFSLTEEEIVTLGKMIARMCVIFLFFIFLLFILPFG